MSKEETWSRLYGTSGE